MAARPSSGIGISDSGTPPTSGPALGCGTGTLRRWQLDARRKRGRQAGGPPRDLAVVDGRLLGRLPHGDAGLPPVLTEHARGPGHRVPVGHRGWLDVDDLDAQILRQLLHHPGLDLLPADKRAIDEHRGIVVDLAHRNVNLAVGEARTQNPDRQDRIVVRECAAGRREDTQQQNEDCSRATTD